MSRRGVTLVTSAGIALLLGVLAAVLPVPYVILVPGPPTDTLGAVPGSEVTQVISVDGAPSYSPNGHLYLTTVGVEPGSCDAHPNLFQALRAWFDPHDAVQPHQAICPPDQSSKSVAQENASEMSQSQQDAITAALIYLGYKPVSVRFFVQDTDPSAPSSSVLQVGDAIVAINGTKVTSSDQLHTLVHAVPADGPITVTVDRDGVSTTVHTRVTHSSLLGISLDQHATFKGVDVHIGIDPNQVGGPSAGLMFTLGIIDKLTKGGLTGGRTIAGTGTIDGFGNVGPIGGIQQKIAAITGHGPSDAPKVNASYFLAPASECADAKAAAPRSLTVIKVDTLTTAVAALKSILAGRTDFPLC